MKKALTCVALTLLIALPLSGCGLVDHLVDRFLPQPTVQVTPRQMVQQLDVTLHPADAQFTRCYVTQENLNPLLTMLRDMVTEDVPEQDPDLYGGQSYYTITATYADGSSQHYLLLGYQYLRVGDNPWCLVSHNKVMEFAQFIQDHPSDDGSYIPPETQAPQETTLPVETDSVSTENPQDTTGT